MNKLIEIIQKLKSDVYAAITVIDKAKPLQKVCTDQTGQMLIEKHGSIENFFETLNKNGVKELLVIVRRKNGSTFKEDSKYAPIEMSFESKAQDQQNYSQAQSQNSMNWLAGGLNQMDSIYKMMDHTRLVQELESFKAKNEILEKQNKELLEKNLRNEISGSNSAANTELFKTLAPLLMPLVHKFAAVPDSTPALAQPGLSPIKQNFMQIVNASPDENIEFLISIMKHFANENYVKELDELILKYDGGN